MYEVLTTNLSLFSQTDEAIDIEINDYLLSAAKMENALINEWVRHFALLLAFAFTREKSARKF